MNKKLIFLIMIISTLLQADSHFYRDENGWYSRNETTGAVRDISSSENTSDPSYWERNYPYQDKSYLTSFKTADRTYVDQTNRDMGNR